MSERYQGSSDETRVTILDLTIDSFPNSRISLGASTISIFEETADARVLGQTNEWLLQCLEHHKHCQKASDPTYYPPRLLMLAADTIRLIDTTSC